MSDIDKYQISFIQVGPFQFDLTVISPDGHKFTNKNVQVHPQQINNYVVYEHFKNKDNFRQHWALDVEELKKDEIMPITGQEVIIYNK